MATGPQLLIYGDGLVRDDAKYLNDDGITTPTKHHLTMEQIMKDGISTPYLIILTKPPPDYIFSLLNSLPKVTFYKSFAEIQRPPIYRIKVYTRYDKYFYEVYLTIKPFLDSLQIPHEFCGTYCMRKISRFEDNTLYIFLSAPETPVPACNFQSYVIMWYFEQPTAGYLKKDLTNGWFERSDLIIVPWLAMQQKLLKEGFSTHVLYVPYTYHSSLRTIEIKECVEKDIDVFFCGAMNERRIQLEKSLKTELFCNVIFTNEAFGNKLDEYLMRSKIVLNVHYYMGAYLEIHRLNKILSYDVCVVSENSDDPDMDEIYAQYIDFCSMEKITNYVDHLLKTGTWKDKISRCGQFREQISGWKEWDEIMKKIIS